MTDPSTPNAGAPLTEEELARIEELHDTGLFDYGDNADVGRACRTITPRLIAEVRRLRAEMASLRTLAVSTDLQED